MHKNKSDPQKRLFISLDVAEDVRRYLYEIAVKLNREENDIKRISFSNIHITLKFLGNVNIGKIDKIISAIRKTADNFEHFYYRLDDRLDAFPGLLNARVIFVPLKEGNENVIKVYNDLENNLSKIKIRKEKRNFIPHITIARIKNRKNIEKIVKGLRVHKPGRIHCNKIILFESILKTTGAEYNIIKGCQLK
jgi:2'-5' RNA ligase